MLQTWSKPTSNGGERKAATHRVAMTVVDAVATGTEEETAAMRRDPTVRRDTTTCSACCKKATTCPTSTLSFPANMRNPSHATWDGTKKKMLCSTTGSGKRSKKSWVLRGPVGKNTLSYEHRALLGKGIGFHHAGLHVHSKRSQKSYMKPNCSRFCTAQAPLHSESTCLPEPLALMPCFALMAAADSPARP